MKALSLRQPWAHAVVHLGKRLENRRWSTQFRGEFLIHASAGIGNLGDFDDACEIISRELDEETWLEFRDECLDIRMSGERSLFVPRKAIKLGGIIGRASLVDVVAPCRARSPKSTVKKSASFKDAFAHKCKHRWHAPEQHAFVLEDVRATAFVPFRGALSFFEVPDDIAQKAVAT